MELVQAALDLGVKLITEGKGTVIQKFLILRLLKDCCLAKCGKIINGLANNKQLLSGIEEVCMYDAGNQDENRGKTLFKSQDP